MKLYLKNQENKFREKMEKHQKILDTPILIEKENLEKEQLAKQQIKENEIGLKKALAIRTHSQIKKPTVITININKSKLTTDNKRSKSQDKNEKGKGKEKGRSKERSKKNNKDKDDKKNKKSKSRSKSRYKSSSESTDKTASSTEKSTEKSTGSSAGSSSLSSSETDDSNKKKKDGKDKRRNKNRVGNKDKRKKEEKGKIEEKENIKDNMEKKEEITKKEIAKRSLRTFKYLVKQKLPINGNDYTGKSPIHSCSIFGNYKTLKYLIKKKSVNPNVKDKYGNTPLYYATFHGHLKIIKFLKANGGNMKNINKNSETCLHAAIWGRYKYQGVWEQDQLIRFETILNYLGTLKLGTKRIKTEKKFRNQNYVTKRRMKEKNWDEIEMMFFDNSKSKSLIKKQKKKQNQKKFLKELKGIY
ncbi:ankyrin repeat ph and sec7 domain containing protein secg-related [Anaeramoeba flamelloides]|uniref:Ankyrin repeat ph and sec7 domain containing protein secg-related n=1 Tax=Anaeramoeba flamelloides TaxID=1746091 RepID=A0AAV7YII7_9EUKA|nr:ankyrin repeat ph and sec7 domain containing protein secg-related [Anaeramoeba flamelloides]